MRFMNSIKRMLFGPFYIYGVICSDGKSKIYRSKYKSLRRFKKRKSNDISWYCITIGDDYKIIAYVISKHDSSYKLEFIVDEVNYNNDKTDNVKQALVAFMSTFEEEMQPQEMHKVILNILKEISE